VVNYIDDKARLAPISGCVIGVYVAMRVKLRGVGL